MLSDFTATANAIAATTKKSEKERILAEYLRSLDDASLERAAVFFSGGPFPRREQRVTGVGGATIGEAVAQAIGRTQEEVWAAWSKYADPGDTIAAALEAADHRPKAAVTLVEVGEYFDRLAATPGSNAKTELLAELFRKVDAQGARYIVKILTNEMRIGLVEGLVESAIAKAFGRTLEAVRRANMFTGDIGTAALLARSDSLDSAKMTLFRPFAFMLAQPEEAADDIFAALGDGAYADDKYDGIRAQIHRDGDEVRIYSRTLDDVTHRFPEIEAAARELGRSVILDGEIVAFRERILPFAVIQKRLGRRKVSETLLSDAPVVFFAFDLLYLDGEALFETPLHERALRLAEVLRVAAAAPGRRSAPEAAAATLIRLCDRGAALDGAHLDKLFDQARARANEGLVIKDPQSIYAP